MKYSAVSSVGRAFKRIAGGSNSHPRTAAIRHAIHQSGLFVPSFYQDKYRYRLPKGMDSLTHYIEQGARDGFAPNPWFDTDFYLANNPDVAAAGLNPLFHFAQHGWAELRSPSRGSYDFVWHWVMENRDSSGVENPMKRHCEQYMASSAAIDVRAFKPLTAEEVPLFVDACHALLAGNRSTEGALCAIGRYAVDNQLWATAEEAFHALILKRPDVLDYRLALADAVERQGRIWQVVDVLAEATDQAPGNADLLFRLGDTREKMGRNAEAATAFAKAVALNGEAADWHYRHGYALEQSGQTALAKAAYDRARQLDEKLDSARFGIGIFHQSRGLWKDAVSAYEAIITQQPADADLWFKLGFAHDRCYDWVKAQHAYSVALSLQFSSPYWHYRLGFVLERQEKWREAAGAYRTAADMDKQHRAYWYYRCGYVLDKAGAYAEACCAYLLTSKACWDTFKATGTAAYSAWFPELQDHSAPSAENTGGLAGGIADTIDGYLETISQEGRATIRRQSGHVHLRARMMEARGDGEAAVRAYRLALDLSADHEPAWYHDLGRLLTRLGRYEEACETFRNSRVLKRPYGVDFPKYEANKKTKALMEYCEYLETLPIRKNTILYESFHGASIGCNPYAMFRYVVDQPEFAGWRHVWVINEGTKIPDEYADRENVIFIPRDCDAYRRYLATVEYLINNSTFPYWFIRRDGQKYLNTWHGTPLKSMGKDVKNEFVAYGNITRNFLHATHMLSPNRHTSDVLMKRHDAEGIYAGKFAETGYPRIDHVINTDDARKQRLLDNLGLTRDKPIVLYAPTWRGRMGSQEVDLDQVIADVSAMISEDYQLIFRGHYFMESALAGLGIPVAIAPHRIDSCDLLSVVDLLITDYSSIFFDFLPARRPIIYYTYDLEEYSAARGFYLDMADLPGTLCATVEDVREAITQGLGRSVEDDPAYQQALARFCPFEDGNATRRAVDFLFFGSEASVIDRYDDPRQSIIMYASVFGANGITASYLNLLRSLENENIQISTLCEPAKIKINPIRIQKFNSMPETVKRIAQLGRMVMTPEEIWITRRFNVKQTLLEAQEMRDIYWRAHQREYRHIFGNMKHDAFVNFDGYNPAIAAIAAAAPASVQKTIYMHSDMIEERNLKWPFLDKLFLAYNRYDHLVSVSGALNQVNRKKLGQEFDIGEEKFASCDNTIDINSIVSMAKAPLDGDLMPWFGGNKTFICLGRMSPEKDHAKLIRAFSGVINQHPDARLVILGDGPLRQDLNFLIEALGIGRSVKLAGLRMNPFPAMKASACFVLSSNHEGQPVVLLEAMVLGKPIIATDIDGNRGVLGDEYGELVENSEAGLRAGMLAFLERGGRPYSFSASEYQSKAVRSFRRIVLSEAEDGPKETVLEDISPHLGHRLRLWDTRV